MGFYRWFTSATAHQKPRMHDGISKQTYCNPCTLKRSHESIYYWPSQRRFKSLASRTSNYRIVRSTLPMDGQLTESSFVAKALERLQRSEILSPSPPPIPPPPKKKTGGGGRRKKERGKGRQKESTLHARIKSALREAVSITEHNSSQAWLAVKSTRHFFHIHILCASTDTAASV